RSAAGDGREGDEGEGEDEAQGRAVHAIERTSAAGEDDQLVGIHGLGGRSPGGRAEEHEVEGRVDGDPAAGRADHVDAPAAGEDGDGRAGEGGERPGGEHAIGGVVEDPPALDRDVAGEAGEAGAPIHPDDEPETEVALRRGLEDGEAREVAGEGYGLV